MCAPDQTVFPHVPVLQSPPNVNDGPVFTLAVSLGTSPVVATPIGALAGAITNFLLNRHVTFRAQGGGVSRQALRYLAVSACSLGLNTLGEGLLYGVWRLQFLLARIATSVLVGLGWNFPLHRFWVFAPDRRPGERAGEQRGSHRG